MIAFDLGNGLLLNNITSRWNWHLKKSTDIIKPKVSVGAITWTAEMDAQFTCMINDGYTYDTIASELGNGF